jgi:hypothetical protein
VPIQEERVAMSRAERAALIMDLLNEIIGLGPIEPLSTTRKSTKSWSTGRSRSTWSDAASWS